MTISQSFNLQANKSDYATEYFPEELMDPDVWTFPVTDKGIDGIEILHKEHGLWENVVRQNNIGRVFGTDQSKVKQIREDIEQNGVDPSTPPVFVDIETGDIITGGHRHDSSGMLSIPGWMFQYVRCKNHWARKRFAKALNNERVFHATLNDKPEVIEHIKYGIKHNEITCQQHIEDEIKLIANNSLSKTVQKTVVKEMVSYIATQGITTVKVERFTSHNDTTYQEFVDRSSDTYVKDVLNNPDVRNFYINMDNFGSRVNGLIAATAKTPLNSHLNIQASVPLPSRTESLNIKREKVHGTFLQNLADNLDEVFTYKIKNGCYAFQHPNCDHVFLAQDHENEDVNAGEFIRKSS